MAAIEKLSFITNEESIEIDEDTTFLDIIDFTKAVTSVAGKSGEVTLTKSDIGLGSVDDTADIDKTVKNASYLVADDSELGTWFTGGSPSMIFPHIGGFGNVTVPTAPPSDAQRGPLPNYGSEMKYVTQALGNSGKYVQLAYSPELTRAFMRSFNGTSLTAWVELFTVNSPEIKLDAARAIYVDADGTICARAGADSVFKISTAIGLNVGIGSHSLETLNGGDRNSAIGWYTLSNTANGSQNSAIGYDAGGRLADNATPQENVSNSVFLGARTHGATSDGVTNTIVIGYNAASQGSNSITLGNSSITKLSCQVTAITALSDSRLKEEISPADLSMCLDAVINLPVSRYKYKNFTGTHVDEHVTGWLADDVSAVFPKSVSVCDKIFPLLDSDGEQLYEEDGETPRTFLMENVKEITMTEAIPTLWGAVQALAARVAALENTLAQ
ncbi:hypothetical protein FACS1894188_08750 [Clostridia bacterium]|nr:hypothetical protein FACS1894188_08750 [Clostridia bacterium]